MPSLDRFVLLVLLFAVAAAWRKLGLNEAASESASALTSTSSSTERQHLSVFAASIAAALLASLSPWWRRWRTPALFTVRLLACTLAFPASADRILNAAPSTFLADGLRTLFGERPCVGINAFSTIHLSAASGGQMQQRQLIGMFHRALHHSHTQAGLATKLRHAASAGW